LGPRHAIRRLEEPEIWWVATGELDCQLRVVFIERKLLDRKLAEPWIRFPKIVGNFSPRFQELRVARPSGHRYIDGSVRILLLRYSRRTCSECTRRSEGGRSTDKPSSVHVFHRAFTSSYSECADVANPRGNGSALAFLFDASSRDALNELLLREEEHHDNRNNTEECSCHLDIPDRLSRVHVYKGHQRLRDHLKLPSLKEHQRSQKLVPTTQECEDGERGERRSRQG